MAICPSMKKVTMRQLIVRNLEEDMVRELKRRAARHGRSAEAEHRVILREALLPEPTCQPPPRPCGSSNARLVDGGPTDIS